MDTAPQKFGLIPETPDPRDFSQEKVFGAFTAEELPQGDFFVSDPLKIKDQGPTDFCTGYAAAAVLEDHEHMELSGPYIFATAKRLLAEKTGNPEEYKKWGLQLRDVCEAVVKVGALQEDLSPYKTDQQDYLRDELANPKNWGDDYDMLAGDHRQASYFNVDGALDRFDNFRSALARGKASGNSILTGVLWRYSWKDAPGGIIPVDYDPAEGGEPHAIKIFGQILMDPREAEADESGAVPGHGKKEIYLVAQLSNSERIGDKGLFYIPRNVINKEFVYGAKQFSDMSKDEALNLIDHGLKVNDNRFYKLMVVLWHLFTGKLGIRK